VLPPFTAHLNIAPWISHGSVSFFYPPFGVNVSSASLTPCAPRLFFLNVLTGVPPFFALFFSRFSRVAVFFQIPTSVVPFSLVSGRLLVSPSAFLTNFFFSFRNSTNSGGGVTPGSHGVLSYWAILHDFFFVLDWDDCPSFLPLVTGARQFFATRHCCLIVQLFLDK